MHICEGYVGSGFLKSDEKTLGGVAAVALVLGREEEPYSGGEMPMEYFIFGALGFAGPENVDLKKGDKLARKQRPKAPAEHYSMASDPLCFRY